MLAAACACALVSALLLIPLFPGCPAASKSAWPAPTINVAGTHGALSLDMTADGVEATPLWSNRVSAGGRGCD